MHLLHIKQAITDVHFIRRGGAAGAPGHSLFRLAAALPHPCLPGINRLEDKGKDAYYQWDMTTTEGNHDAAVSAATPDTSITTRLKKRNPNLI